MRQILFTTALLAMALTSPALAEDYKVILKCTEVNAQSANKDEYVELDFAKETMRYSDLNELKDGLVEGGVVLEAHVWGYRTILFVENFGDYNLGHNYFRFGQSVISLNRVTGEMTASSYVVDDRFEAETLVSRATCKPLDNGKLF